MGRTRTRTAAGVVLTVAPIALERGDIQHLDPTAQTITGKVCGGFAARKKARSEQKA